MQRLILKWSGFKNVFFSFLGRNKLAAAMKKTKLNGLGWWRIWLYRTAGMKKNKLNGLGWRRIWLYRYFERPRKIMDGFGSQRIRL